MRRRLVVATFAAASLAVVSGPVLVLGTEASPHHYVIALVGGAALSAYMAWLFDVGLFTPTLTPVVDLIEGAQRVQRGDLGSSVPVSSLDELGDLALAFNAMQAGLRERAALQAAFGSYVDPLLAQRLLESGSSMFEGEEVVVTVLFLDVRDFTAYSDDVAPADAVALLNRLFDVVVPIVHAHGGHANHYLGDGLLAVFGAPQPLRAHADAAVAAAIEVQGSVRRDLGDELRIGIGINTGPVIAGTVGGGGRHEFTVIGDTVNVAARVEQLTKETGDRILVTEATRLALSTPRPRTRRRGSFEVRGNSAAVLLHAVHC
jgi:class 3 adenylate cyclase